MALDALRHGLNTLGRLASVTALTAALVVGASGAAHAGDTDWDTGVDDGGADVGGTQPGTGGSPGTGGPGGGGTITVPGPWTQRIYVPYCPANLVRSTGPGIRDYETIDDMCGAVSSCPADDESRYWVFSRPMGPDNRATGDGSFDRDGVVCRGVDEPNESEPPTITVDEIIDRARALAPTPTFVIEPGNGTYVNIPTNFAAQVEPVTVNVTVLGFTIPVEFTPGDVRWSFGDGVSGSGVGVRNADVGEAGAVEHSYARSGEYDVSLSVAYNVRINLPDGPIEVPTPINRTAAPRALAVGEIQSVVTEVD